MPKRVLTPEDKVAILSTPAGTTHRELARRLRRAWPTIARFRSRVRRAGGWYTAVALIDRAQCRRPLVSSHTRKVHRGCHADRSRAWDREWWRARPAGGGHQHLAQLRAAIGHRLGASAAGFAGRGAWPDRSA
jgi:hypothetical protein